jgi:hypothetical protein
MSFCMLTPSYLLHRIDYIYYKSDQLGVKPRKALLYETIEKEKGEVRQAEYKTIRKIKHIPLHLI